MRVFKIQEMKYCLFIIIIFTSTIVKSQDRNSVWCFGDSAGIDFGSGVAVPIASGMDGRGSCASIADENGNLLFYAAKFKFFRPTAFGKIGEGIAPNPLLHLRYKRIRKT